MDLYRLFNLVQVEELLHLGGRTLEAVEALHRLKVPEDWEHLLGLALDDFFCHFDEVVETLLGHHCIVAFKRNRG